MFGKLNKKYQIIFKLKHIIADLFAKIFLISKPNKWSVLIADKLNHLFLPIKVRDQEVRLLSNTDLLLYRSKTLNEKEPETNRWIASMPADGVFFDVGANVGVFTILASFACRRVYAFEPVALNYSVLNQNISENKLDRIATAYCLAISDRSEFNTMRLSSTVIGSAHHTFGSNLDASHETFTPVFEQGSLSMSLDDLVYKHNFDCPTYLKIDVDGNEHLVLAGASKLLQDSRLKSILIELNKNLKVDQGLVSYIQSCGFLLVEEGEEAIYKGSRIGNLIFSRTAIH